MFPNAREKIKRAKQHIAELNRVVGDVVGQKGQIAWTEIAPNGMQIANYRIDGLSALPDIALVLGDAIHNLKTALDYVWVDTVSALVPASVSKYSKFPVYQTLKLLKDALDGINLPASAPALYRFILDDVKPYESGDFFIWAVHELDKIDKHKLLIPTTNYGAIVGLKLKDKRGEVHTVGSMGTEFGGVYSVAIPLGVTIDDHGKSSIEITFKEEPVKSLEVCDTLRMFSVKVLNIVELFEYRFGRLNPVC